eukprot:782433-Pleurochrysis_carterae.AAC.1
MPRAELLYAQLLKRARGARERSADDVCGQETSRRLRRPSRRKQEKLVPRRHAEIVSAQRLARLGFVSLQV